MRYQWISLFRQIGQILWTRHRNTTSAQRTHFLAYKDMSFSESWKGKWSKPCIHSKAKWYVWFRLSISTILLTNIFINVLSIRVLSSNGTTSCLHFKLALIFHSNNINIGPFPILLILYSISSSPFSSFRESIVWHIQSLSLALARFVSKFFFYTIGFGADFL